MQAPGIDSYFSRKSVFTILIILGQHLFPDFLLACKNTSNSQTWLCHHQTHPVRFFWISTQIAPSFFLWPDAPSLAPRFCASEYRQSTLQPACIWLYSRISRLPWYRATNFLKYLASPGWKCPCHSLLWSWCPFLRGSGPTREKLGVQTSPPPGTCSKWPRKHATTA